MRRIFFLIFALTLTGAQCISFGGSNGARAGAGGVFRSSDRGDSWQQKVAIPSVSGQPRNFGGANVVAFVSDPQDAKTLYVGTQDNGLFYSLDSGETWLEPPPDLRKGYVAAVAVDPKNKCTVYVASSNRVLKTQDCLRTFAEVYRDAAADGFVTTLTIDPQNPTVLYAGTARGALVKSLDGGRSWALLKNFEARTTAVVVDVRNPQVVWAAFSGKGLWRSENSGISWTRLQEGLKQFSDSQDIRKLILDRATTSGLLMSTRTKLLRSTDGGTTWTRLPLISPETVEILALAVNPASSRELYYGTATTFYRSLDGGATWSTKKIPTNRAITAILVDHGAPAVVFVGVTEVKK